MRMTNGNKNIEPADKDYQDLFLRSHLGPKVLGKMMDECHFGQIAIDDQWQAAQNFMKIVLDRCGISFVGEGEKMVRALMKKRETITELEVT